MLLESVFSTVWSVYFVSDEGCQQGDPLGPLLFCATVMPLINRLQSTFNVWYMDDGSIGDNADVLLNDFQLLIAEGKNLGLNANTAKCELIIDDEFVLEKLRTVAPDIYKSRFAVRCSVAWCSNWR